MIHRLKMVGKRRQIDSWTTCSVALHKPIASEPHLINTFSEITYRYYQWEFLDWLIHCNCSCNVELCGNVVLQQASRIITLCWSCFGPMDSYLSFALLFVSPNMTAGKNIWEATNLAEHNLLHAQILRMSSEGIWSF